MSNSIKEYLETIDSFEIWADAMGNLADENYDKTTIYEISKENLFNSDAHHNFEEVQKSKHHKMHPKYQSLFARQISNKNIPLLSNQDFQKA